MKRKLILISIIGMMLSGCNSIFGNKLIVKEAKSINNSCVYEVETFGINIDIYDDCGKYNVGDTIKLTK